MVYKISKSLRRQVEAYVVVEELESGTGYLLLTILGLQLGTFGQDMTATIFWSEVALTLLLAMSKLLRGFIKRMYFHGMSCNQIASGQGRAYRATLGSFTLLNGLVDSTFAYVAMIAVAHLLTIVIQVQLGLTLYHAIPYLQAAGPDHERDSTRKNPPHSRTLYQAIPSLQGCPEYEKRLGTTRLYELLLLTCVFLLIHSLLMFILIFFSRVFFPIGRLIWDCCAFLLYLVLGRCCQRRQGLASQESQVGRSMDSAEISSVDEIVPLWERLCRIRTEMELGVTWYVHCSRHFFYPPGEAQTNTDECGLSGYWFHSMAELLDKVRDSMHDLASDGGGEGTVAVEGGGGGGGGEDVRRREVVSMTLRSLLELSQQNIACCWHRAGSEGMVASHVQDLPQTSRCRHDVDAGIDFAREQGYLTMLQVIKCSALDTEHIRLAAQIVAGFASGLSVLPWQPHQRLHGEHWILGMLCDDDFTYWTKNLVRTLVQLVQRRCVAEEELTPSAIVAGTRGEDVKRRPLQKAAMSAICSLANAASDIHAHYHDHLRLRGIAEGREEGEEKVFLQGELAYSSRPSNTVSPKSPKSPNQLGKRYLSYASRLSNGFTTLCPVGWMLESEIPDFTQASTVWAECVKSVLTEESTLDILLAWVTSVPNDSDNIAADSLRILASLWSCRMISWHRFDQRLPADFPPPMDTIKAGTVRDRLKQLVCRCSKHDPKALSSFSKLHLAKILISQNIRGLDSDVTEILLQCLCFWRLALGKRDMDWFACETMETLRDLLTTSNEPDKLRCLIFASPGGENCLRLMLNGDVSRFLSVRFFEERALFNHKLSQYMLKNDWKKPWAVDAEVDVARCVATAAALFGDLLCLNPKPSQLSQVSPYLDTVRGAPVIRTLYQSLCSIVDTPDIQQRVTDKQSTTFPPSFISSFTEALASYNLFPRLVLLVWESLGNPGWRPPFGLFDDINSVLIDASENRMEYFERSVNCLLGMRNATRVLHLLLARHQVLVSSDLLPTLVRLLIIPYPKLQRRLGLQNWEREVHYQIKEHVADMVMLVLPRLEKDLKGQDGPKPLTSTTLSVLSELQLWTAKEDQMDKEKRRRDIEGGTGCGPKVQCLLNHLNVIQGLTGMAMAQQCKVVTQMFLTSQCLTGLTKTSTGRFWPKGNR